jgi:Zn-dependent protease
MIFLLLLYIPTMTNFIVGMIPDLEVINILKMTFLLGFKINSFLALFNLIPFSILDGAKVFRWDPIIWLVTAGFAGILVFFAFFGSFI